MQYVVCACTHALLFVMKTFTKQYLISQKEYMSVLPKTELTIRHLVVAIFTNCCNINPLNAELNPISKSQLAELFCGAFKFWA